MTADMIELELHTSTQYATAYVGEQPIATVSRRPYTGVGPAWRATGVFGDWNGRTIAIIHANMSEARATELLKRRIAGHYTRNPMSEGTN